MITEITGAAWQETVSVEASYTQPLSCMFCWNSLKSVKGGFWESGHQKTPGDLSTVRCAVIGRSNWFLGTFPLSLEEILQSQGLLGRELLFTALSLPPESWKQVYHLSLLPRVLLWAFLLSCSDISLGDLPCPFVFLPYEKRRFLISFLFSLPSFFLARSLCLLNAYFVTKFHPSH